MRKGVRVLALLLSGFVSFMAARHLRLRQMARAERTPFTIYMHESARTLNVEPVQSHERDFFYAVRRDGSRVFANFQKLANGMVQMGPRRVASISERKVAIVSNRGSSATTTYLSEEAAMKMRQRPSDPTCRTGPSPRFRFVSEDSFLGFRVAKVVAEDETAHTEFWQALDLDCYAIRGLVKWKGPGGGVTEVTEQAAVRVIPGEPEAELFQVSNKYQEKPPSQFYMDEAVPPAELSNSVREKLNRLDENYTKSKKGR